MNGIPVAQSIAVLASFIVMLWAALEFVNAFPRRRGEPYEPWRALLQVALLFSTASVVLVFLARLPDDVTRNLLTLSVLASFLAFLWFTIQASKTLPPRRKGERFERWRLALGAAIALSTISSVITCLGMASG